MPTQRTPVIATPPEAQIPNSVRKYASDHGIGAALSAAGELAMRVFPSVRSIIARLQEDLDSGDVCVILDIESDAEAAEVLAGKRAYTREWVRICPAEARERISLLFHLV